MVKVLQNSWTGGQLDFEMMGRQDYQKYMKGASVLKNFNILKRGGITKRQGFDRLLDLAAIGIDPLEDAVRIVPFSYSKEHGFVLIFSPDKCTAVCTVEGSVYRAFDVPYADPDDYSRPFTTKEEMLTFDYQQCGYKLYVASRFRKPSVIYATAAGLEAALAPVPDGEPQPDSPFTWERFIPEVTGGVPTITSFKQTRVPPTDDSCGGLVTEKYKVSAVFDDEEGDACEEAFNSTHLEPVQMSVTVSNQGVVTVTNGTLVNATVNKGYKATTTGGGTSDQTTTYPNTAVETYVNKKAKQTCAGTAYYAPWVEGQVIRLNITVNPRTVGSALKYPSEVRVYKKAFGTYGLIGTIKVGGKDGESKKLISTATISGTSPSEKRVTSADTGAGNTFRHQAYPTKTIAFGAYESSTTWKNDDVPSKHGLHKSGWYLRDGASMTITPASKPYLDTAKIKIHFGTAYRHFSTTKYDLGYKGRPLAQTSYAVYNRAETLTLGISYTYIPSGESEPSTGTATITVDTSDYVKKNNGTVVKYESDTYDVSEPNSYYGYQGDYIAFKNNCNTRVDTFLNSRVAPQEDLTINLADYEGDMSIPAGATDVSINSITITVGNGTHPSGYDAANTMSAEGLMVFTGIMLSGVPVALTSVTFDDNNITPDTSITPLEPIDDPLFDGPSDFPAVVCLTQQRLVWASTKRKPETIWMSAVGDFSQYRQHEVAKSDDALDFAMPVTQFANLNHLVEMKKLLAFNSACEWTIESTSAVEGITADTIMARPQSYLGSNQRLKPQVCNNSVVFCERTCQAVRRFAYNIQDDGFAGKDVSILSSSIFERNNITDWTYQQFPHSILWCALSDGSMASLTMMDEQDILAWGTHEHGGGGKVLALSTSRAVSPSLEDIKTTETVERAYQVATHEEVFAIVRQDGQMWLERMRVRSAAEDTIYNALCLDAMRVVMDASDYDADDHKDGIMPAADGRIWVLPVDATLGGLAYTAGSILSRQTAIAMLQNGVAQIYEGSLFEARMVGVFPIVGNEIGAGQFDIKDIVNVGLRLEASSGGSVASARTDASAVPIRYADDLDNDKTMTIAGGKVHLKNVDCANVKPFGANFRDGRVVVMQSEPWAFTLLSMETDYATETEGGAK